MEITYPQADRYQSFFNFMFSEYGIVLTVDDMDEIIKECKKIETNEN